MASLVYIRMISLLIALAAPCSALVVGYDPIGSNAFGDPNSSGYVVSFNQVADGVNLNGEVLIESGVGTCTGSLLSDGESILTAAHCLDPSATAAGVLNGTVSIAFDQGCGSGFFCGGYASATFFIDPGYLADNGAMCSGPGVLGSGIPCASFQGDDLAVIRLNQQAPASATRYSLFTENSIDIATPIELAGAGYTGQGCIGGSLDTSDGSCPQNSAYAPEISAVMRQGENYYLGTCSGCAYILLGQFNPNSNLSNQVFVAPGDSGGGSFYNGQLIGVHDFDSCDTGRCSITGTSYFGDTYVGGTNAAWIESVEASVPEPPPVALLGIGVAVLLRCRRRSRTSGQSDVL